MTDDVPDLATREIHTTVENLIFLNGDYRPVELLIHNGLLDYADYEGWRLGHISILCDTLRADTAFIQTYLSHAEQFAKNLGLIYDYLVPFWQYQAKLTLALTFDPSQPKLHACWAYQQLFQWSNVRDSIQAIPNWTDCPWLCCRLTEALYHLSARQHALSVLINLCWTYPDAFEHDLATSAQLDISMKSAWKAFIDLDFDTPLETPFFPTYLLLHEPSLVKLIEVTPTDPQATHQNAFFSVYSILYTNTPYDTKLNKKTLRLRTMLQISQGDLFTLYLEKFSQHSSQTMPSPVA